MSPSLLALETSTEFCSIALIGPHGVLLRHEHTGAQSSMRVLPLVQALLDEAQLGLSDLSAIAFGAGPGAFTGLRGACAHAQGLAFGADLPIIAVDTLMSCAERARQEEGHLHVLVALDARMGEAYWGQYEYINGRWQTHTPPQLSRPTEISSTQSNICLAGNASTIFAEQLAHINAKHTLPLCMPRADCVAQLALSHLAAGEVLRPEQAQPIYIRNKIALTIKERNAC